VRPLPGTLPNKRKGGDDLQITVKIKLLPTQIVKAFIEGGAASKQL
jgi:hypothetical protein